MDKHRARTRQGSSTAGGLGGFRLPPDVSFSKQELAYGGWAFVFRHRVLGDLGRIVLQERDDGFLAKWSATQPTPRQLSGLKSSNP
jgi:hypothetical protein